MWPRRTVYATREQKRRDFILGLVGWYAVNGALLVLNLATPRGPDGAPRAVVDTLVALPWVLNVGGLILFGFTRHWVALGMLGAFAALLALLVIAGVFLTVACFVLLASGGQL
jgi:hypothetical protein